MQGRITLFRWFIEAIKIGARYFPTFSLLLFVFGIIKYNSTYTWWYNATDFETDEKLSTVYIDGLVHYCSIPVANPLELLQFCNKQSKWNKMSKLWTPCFVLLRLDCDYNMVRWISAPGTMHFRPRYDTFWPCGLFTLLQFCKPPPPPPPPKSAWNWDE